MNYSNNNLLEIDPDFENYNSKHLGMWTGEAI
jgi:hypothetical protein